MITPIQFHPVHGEHIKLSRNNTIAKRVDSFCKGICFSNRTIQIREKVYVRLLNKSVQWTGFLRLGVTTCDPNTHRTSSSLPRHACPDLTCRPGSLFFFLLYSINLYLFF
jgi:protein neuralized